MEQYDGESLLKHFLEYGYVYIPGFLNEVELNDIEDNLSQLIKEKVPQMSSEHAFYENTQDPSSLKQIQTLFSYSDFFFSLMFTSKFQRLASFLLQGEVVGKNLQYFNKPPQIGKATPAHQDGYYFKLEPNEALTMWLGLDEVDEENGCVRYVKASHLKGMRPHSNTQTLGFSQGINNYGDDDTALEIWFNTKPGDLLVHHSLTIHRADPNNSVNRSRRALGFIYYSKTAKENAEEKQKYEEQLKTITHRDANI